MTTIINPLSDRNGNALPVTVRFPKKGQRCWISGLSRSTLYALTSGENPPVATVNVSTRSESSRGARLILVSSLLNYLYEKGHHRGEARRVLAGILGEVDGDHSADAPSSARGEGGLMEQRITDAAHLAALTPSSNSEDGWRSGGAVFQPESITWDRLAQLIFEEREPELGEQLRDVQRWAALGSEDSESRDVVAACLSQYLPL